MVHRLSGRMKLIKKHYTQLIFFFTLYKNKLNIYFLIYTIYFKFIIYNFYIILRLAIDIAKIEKLK